MAALNRSSNFLPVLEYATECANHVQVDIRNIETFLNTCRHRILSLTKWRRGWRRYRSDLLRKRCLLTSPLGLINPLRLACYEPAAAARLRTRSRDALRRSGSSAGCYFIQLRETLLVHEGPRAQRKVGSLLVKSSANDKCWMYGWVHCNNTLKSLIDRWMGRVPRTDTSKLHIHTHMHTSAYGWSTASPQGGVGSLVHILSVSKLLFVDDELDGCDLCRRSNK